MVFEVSDSPLFAAGVGRARDAPEGDHAVDHFLE
jgi:hypothetical protein